MPLRLPVFDSFLLGIFLFFVFVVCLFAFIIIILQASFTRENSYSPLVEAERVNVIP